MLVCNKGIKELRAMGRKGLTFYLNQLCWHMDSRFMVLARLTLLLWIAFWRDAIKDATPQTNYVFMIFWNNLTESSMLKLERTKRHPLYFISVPTVKDCSQRLRRKTFQLPLVKTERFKNCFVNRLCFNCNIRIWYYFNYCNFLQYF